MSRTYDLCTCGWIGRQTFIVYTRNMSYAHQLKQRSPGFPVHMEDKFSAVTVDRKFRILEHHGSFIGREQAKQWAKRNL